MGAVRVAVAGGRATIEPESLVAGDSAPPALRLLVAGTRDRIVMLEAEVGFSMIVCTSCHSLLHRHVGGGSEAHQQVCEVGLRLWVSP